MIPEARRLYAGAAFLLFLCASLALQAELSKQDQEAAKNMVAGTLYLRLDVPLRTVMGGWGIGPESVLEVSPSGHDFERKLALPSKNSRLRKDLGIFWGFFPNDGVRYGKLTFNQDTVEVWMEGVKPYDNEITLDFIHINSLDDFTKAFNQTFSKVPLQGEHPEWPAEVRNAIAERRVVVGMTKEQAFDVVGTPINIATGQDDGIKTETWFLRQDRGTVPSAFRGRSSRTDIPATLKFADGKLQVIEQTSRLPDLTGK